MSELQDMIFKSCEGDRWFERNREYLVEERKDTVVEILRKMNLNPTSIAEVGCSNGWRLEQLRKRCFPEAYYCGFEPSLEAVKAGRKEFPLIKFTQASLAEMESERKFDILICNGVLCWVDREMLLLSICKIDRMLNDGGIIILGDFSPNSNQCRRYHHLKDEKIYTYKQDYAAMFIASGLYKEVLQYTLDYENWNGNIFDSIDLFLSDERWSYSVLKKQSKNEYYLEVE